MGDQETDGARTTNMAVWWWVAFAIGVLCGLGGRQRPPQKKGVKVQGRKYAQRQRGERAGLLCGRGGMLCVVGVVVLLLPTGMGWLQLLASVWRVLARGVAMGAVVWGHAQTGQRSARGPGRCGGGGGAERAPLEGERAMILREEWLKLILSGDKTVEVRGRKAKLGHVWLAHGKKVYGSAVIRQCVEVNLEEFHGL